MADRQYEHEDDPPDSDEQRRALAAMLALTDGERLKIMGYFCGGCGSEQPSSDMWNKCKCWNDE